MFRLTCLAAGFLVLLIGPAVLSQEPPAPPATSAPSPAPEPSAAESDKGTAVPDVLLRTETGELIPLRQLLGSDAVDELLKRGNEQRSLPSYSVNQLELTGSVSRDVVNLTLLLRIHVRTDSEWVSVPLQFGDVYLTSCEHSSESAAAESAAGPGGAGERRWHLRGAGQHTLKLELVGKARTVSPGQQQLRLNLPPAIASHAVLTFATPVEIQKLPTGAVDRTVRNEQGVTSIEFWGLEGATDLSWSEVVPDVSRPPVIQVENRLKLDLTTIPVALSGTQLLQISGNPVNELRIVFPEGYQLQEMDARNAAGVSVLNNFEVVSESGPVTASVRLTSAIEGSLTLSFDLELLNRNWPQDIRVVLPSVDGANIQSGDLDLLFPSGLLVQQTSVKGAQRKRVATQPDLNTTATAFRMRSAESAIELHVEETEAQFAVSPELIVQPEKQNVVLTARFPVSVLQGSLLDLSIAWPGLSGGGWQLLPGSSRLVTEKGNRPLSLQVSDAQPDLLQLTFPERQSGEFSLEFKAFAPVDAVRAGTVQLICPEVTSRRGQPFVLKTVESDEYSIRPVSMGTGELLPTIPVPSATSAEAVPEEQHIESWLLQDPSIPVRLELPAQAPAVRASLIVGIEPHSGGIEVHERIQFQIEHRDLTSFSLNVPEGLRPIVHLSGTAEPLRAILNSATSWSFRLPDARRGRMDIEVRYLWSDPAAGPSGAAAMNGTATATERPVPLPLVLPEASDVTGIEAGTNAFSGLTVAEDSGWTPVFSEHFESAWLRNSSAATVPLIVSGLLRPRHSGPDLLLVNSQLLGNHVLTTTVSVFDTAPGLISFLIPSTAALQDIVLNADPVISRTEESKYRLQAEELRDDGLMRWTVTVPDAIRNASEPLTLEIRVRERVAADSGVWQKTVLRRTVMDGESAAVPVLWFVGSGDEYHVAGVSGSFAQMSTGGIVALPWIEPVQVRSARQLRAAVSPYSDAIQKTVVSITDQWAAQPGRMDFFFGSNETRQLRLQLIPGVLLLLLSAVVCVLIFVVLTLLPRLSMAIPVLTLTAIIVAAWLSVPDWTLLLLPHSLMGVLFGTLCVVFQRGLAARRARLMRISPRSEFPTVFGMSNLLAPSLTGKAEARSRPVSHPSLSPARTGSTHP